jgi:hypothetical protein
MEVSLKHIFVAALLLAASLTLSLNAIAAPTRVGNGDDGTDLELAKKVDSGILIETRADALARIAKLNAQNVPGLGRLLVELEKSEIFYVAHDVKPTAEAEGGGLEHDANVVFARTFPEPVAPTRFFAAALMLEREQLIALHIHEALHRALPPDLRENESTVSQLTLALAAPDSTHDRVQATMAKVLFANRFAAGAATPAAFEAPQAMAAPKSTASFREFLGISQWKAKYKQVEVATRFSNQDAEAMYAAEWTADFRFDELGPLGKTSIEPYIAMGFESFSLDKDGTRGFANGPAGIKIATKLWGDDLGEVFGEYRYVTTTPADSEIRSGYNARTLKEYTLRYRSLEASSYRSNYSVSVVEGTASDMPNLYDFSYGQITNVTYGSMLTAKYVMDIQLTGDVASQRGLVFHPSAELVEIEPTTTTRAPYSTAPGEQPVPVVATSTRSLLSILGLGLSWQGEKFRFGIDAKLSSISRGSAALSQTGDFAEHRFDNLYASTTFAYAL